MNEIKYEAITNAVYLRMATIHLNLHYSSHQIKPASPVKKKKNRHFNKLLRSFPAKRIFNKSVFPINMSSR